MKHLLTIIIPTFNEEQTIHRVLTLVEEVKTPGWDKEIIVIDDGSTDHTKAILHKWTERCLIISQKINQGKGAAVVRGMRYAKGEIIIIQDADLEYKPEEYVKLVAPFSDPRVQVVYGSRFLGAHLSTMYLYALGNKFVTFVTNLLYNTNLTDMETGYKIFRKEVLQGITIHAKRFDFEPEFTAKILKSGHQIYEVPISYYGRKFSEGKKLTWKDGITALITLIKWRLVSDT